MERSSGRDWSVGHSVLGMSRIDVIVVPPSMVSTSRMYYIREVQDKGTGGEVSHILLPELETLDREWSQDEWESGNCRGRKH